MSDDKWDGQQKCQRWTTSASLLIFSVGTFWNIASSVVSQVNDFGCSGWSTVVLNSLGQLFAAGVLNGERYQTQHSNSQQLSFPLGWLPTTKDHHNPDTAIKRYSVGRKDVIGLSDSGRIWQWTDLDFGGRQILFAETNVTTTADVADEEKVMRVVGGNKVI